MVKMVVMVLMALRDLVTVIMRSKSRSSLVLKNEAVGFRPKVLHLLELLQTKKFKTKEKDWLSIFCQPFRARHRLQAVDWVSGWCRCRDCPPSSSPLSRRTSRTTSASCAADGGTGCTESHSLHRRRNSDTNFRMRSTNHLVRVCCAKLMLEKINSRQAN